MSRFGGGSSYGHTIVYHESFGGYWRMYWTVDFYYETSRLRNPRRFSRDTCDPKAARRFAAKWNVEIKNAVAVK